MTQPTTYDPNVPEFRSDSLDTTQPQLQRNFQALFDAFLLNHVSLTAASNAGNHNIIELLERANPINTNASEINVYSKDDPGTTDQLFMRYQLNSPEFAITPYQIYSVKNIVSNGVVITRFFTFLPGKILVYFGTMSGAAARTVTLTLQPAIAKKIITTVGCVSVNPSGLPFVNLVAPGNDGFFKDLTFAIIQPISYLVMANI